MKNHGNFPKYRFEPVARPAPQNETPEERLKRLLAAPERDIRDNKAFLDALRATVETETGVREYRRVKIEEGGK